MSAFVFLGSMKRPLSVTADGLPIIFGEDNYGPRSAAHMPHHLKSERVDLFRNRRSRPPVFRIRTIGCRENANTSSQLPLCRNKILTGAHPRTAAGRPKARMPSKKPGSGPGRRSAQISPKTPLARNGPFFGRQPYFVSFGKEGVCLVLKR